MRPSYPPTSLRGAEDTAARPSCDYVASFGRVSIFRAADEYRPVVEIQRRETYIKPAETEPGTADYPWDDFDSAAYFAENYATLRPDDRAIVEAVRDFFAANLGEGHEGIDVGTGTNLYPALTMLPFCGRLTLLERSHRNRAWLRGEIRDPRPGWDNFWAVLQDEPRYRKVDGWRHLLTERSELRDGSVFDLEESRWDVGTLFFVAESISARRSEFELALSRFVRSLRPGAPFAAAFMENSSGYAVGTIDFPAVSVSRVDISDMIAPWAKDLNVREVPPGDSPLRDGYSGMLLATGVFRGI